MDIDLEGEAAGSAQPAGPSEPIAGPSSRPPAPPPATHSTPSLSSDVMPLLSVRPKRSTARAQADEDKLLAALEERGRQSVELQQQLPVDLPDQASEASEREGGLR